MPPLTVHDFAHEELVKLFVDFLNEMPEKSRIEILGNFCGFCGCYDPELDCTCMRDD